MPGLPPEWDCGRRSSCSTFGHRAAGVVLALAVASALNWRRPRACLALALLANL
jgi:hypothetical protein